MTPTGTDAQQRFEAIWDSVACGIAIIDAETRTILAVNPVAARMHGADPAHLVGKICHQFVCPAETGACPIMDKGQTVDRTERKLLRADGQTLPIIKSVVKINYQGRPALLESFTDISLLKEAEEQLRELRVAQVASQAKSDFLARMSHEMRTPLNAILGMARIAQKNGDAQNISHALSVIVTSASHLLGLVNDVLDMAKIEADKTEIMALPFCLEHLITQVCTMVEDDVEKKKLRLGIAFSESIPLSYTGDVLHISQILVNLLANAVKFTPEGGHVSLCVEEAQRTADSSELRFLVRDSGIGIPQDKIDKLFAPFEQGDGSITRTYGGTGLGLSISQRLAGLMGGKITVSSVPGQGATFVLHLTLPHAPESPLPPVPPHFRCLFVSDDAQLALQFQGIARRLRLHADMASAPKDALTLAQKGSGHDLCLLDLDLLDGQALPLAEALSAHTRHTAFMTGFLHWNSMESSAPANSHFLARQLLPTAVADLVRTCAAQREEASERGQSPDFSQIHVLLVEDIDINQEIFLGLLAETGIHIDVADNGRAALDMLRAHPRKYDLIFMDIQMPEMDGISAAQAIRAQPHIYGTTPIIAMTANAFTEDVEKCLAAGMVGHLSKPIEEEKVLEAIARYCS